MPHPSRRWVVGAAAVLGASLGWGAARNAFRWPSVNRVGGFTTDIGPPSQLGWALLGGALCGVVAAVGAYLAAPPRPRSARSMVFVTVAMALGASLGWMLAPEYLWTFGVNAGRDLAMSTDSTGKTYRVMSQPLMAVLCGLLLAAVAVATVLLTSKPDGGDAAAWSGEPARDH